MGAPRPTARVRPGASAGGRACATHRVSRPCLPAPAAPAPSATRGRPRRAFEFRSALRGRVRPRPGARPPSPPPRRAAADARHGAAPTLSLCRLQRVAHCLLCALPRMLPRAPAARPVQCLARAPPRWNPQPPALPPRASTGRRRPRIAAARAPPLPRLAARRPCPAPARPACARTDRRPRKGSAAAGNRPRPQQLAARRRRQPRGAGRHLTIQTCRTLLRSMDICHMCPAGRLTPCRPRGEGAARAPVK